MNIFSFIFKYFLRYKLNIALMILSTIILWIVTMLTPYITGVFIDSLVQQSDVQIIWQAVALLAVIWTMQLVFSYVRNITNAKVNALISYSIRYDIMESFKKLPLSYFADKDSGNLTGRVTKDSSDVVSFALGAVFALFTSVFTFTVAYIIVFNLNMTVAILVLILLPLYSFVYMKYKTPLYILGKKVAEQSSSFHGTMNKQLANMRLTKHNAWHKRMGTEIEVEFSALYESIMKNARLSYIVNNADTLVRYFTNIVVFVYSGIQIIYSYMTIGQFTMIYTYSLMVISSLSVLFNFGKRYQKAQVAYDRIEEILSAEKDENGEVRLSKISGVKIVNLNFHYQNKHIISRLNLEMKKGYIYGVFGDNGTGKSTFISILCGIEQNYSGQIYVTDSNSKTPTNLKHIDLNHFRENCLAIVPQEPVLYFNTIWENISGGKDEKEVNFWLEELSLVELAGSHKAGQNFKINETTTNLSGGEKQRFSIASAFIKDTDVVIMDEPTSALDKHSIEALCKVLTEVKEEKIIVIVTHEKDLMQVCDEIVRF